MRTTIIVQNLKCQGCSKTITSKLEELPGIENVSVDIENSKVSFGFDDSQHALAVKARLKQLGYPSIEEKNSLLDKTKSFVSCAAGKVS